MVLCGTPYICVGYLSLVLAGNLSIFCEKIIFAHIRIDRRPLYRRSSPCSPSAVRTQAATPLPLTLRRLTARVRIFREIRTLRRHLTARFCIFREIRKPFRRLTAWFCIFQEIRATPPRPTPAAGSRQAPRQQPRARYSVRSAVTGSFFAAMRLGASPAMNDSPTEMSTSAIPGTNGTAARFSTPATW